MMVCCVFSLELLHRVYMFLFFLAPIINTQVHPHMGIYLFTQTFSNWLDIVNNNSNQPVCLKSMFRNNIYYEVNDPVELLQNSRKWPNRNFGLVSFRSLVTTPPELKFSTYMLYIYMSQTTLLSFGSLH